jgi:hypothetical protein
LDLITGNDRGLILEGISELIGGLYSGLVVPLIAGLIAESLMLGLSAVLPM